MTSCGYGMWTKLPEGKFAPVTLTAVSVKVSVINLVAEVQVEQSYRNEAYHPIEVVYKIPLTEGADMFKFSAEINGREMTSKVKEIVDEKTDYEEAVRRDPTEFMMQEQLQEIFMVELGDMAAKSSAKIRYKYITKLKTEGEELRFMLPWTVAPRYVPAKDDSAVAGFWSKLFSKTDHIQEVPYELKFEAAVWMTSGIKDIRSTTHNISESSVFETKRTVTLSETTATMDQDLLLLIKAGNRYEGSLVLEESVKGTSALMLSILPKFKQKEQKAELIFAIDRSSSMKSAGIYEAKRALLLFIHSVRRDCYVNIVAFGSTHHLLFPEGSRKYDAEVLKLVHDYAKAMDADLGGSEILEPLRAIFTLPTVTGYPRKVFLITTDGVVSNKDDVVTLVQKFSRKTRVFTIGLGCNVSRNFLEVIARAGKGTALFTSLKEGLGEKVIQQLRDALRPSWTNIQLEWEGFDKEDLMGTKPLLRQAPANGMIPSVFSGKRLVVYAEGLSTHLLGVRGKKFKGLPMIMKSTDVPDCLSSAMSAVSLRSSSPEPVPTNIKKEEVKGPAGERKMMEVICLQTFYGSFKLDDTLPEILGSSKHDIIEAGTKAHCRGMILDKCKGRQTDLWTTLIAVSFLTLGLPQFRESWALVVEKADIWLSPQFSNQSEETKLKKEADVFIMSQLKL